MINRSDVKQEAKGFVLRGKKSPVMAFLIIVVVTFLINSLASYFTVSPTLSQKEALDLYIAAIEAGDANAAIAAIQSAVPQPTPQGVFVQILGSLFLTLLSAGSYLFCMGIRQGKEMGYGTLIDGLSRAGRIIWCTILMYVRITLWTMLFIVPGVVAAYRYRFAIYNILSDDRLSAGQAIRLSCLQTRGMKSDLLVLDLSFLGWSVLSYFTRGLLNIWLMPYMIFADLAYYEEAQLRLGRIIPQSEDPGASAGGENPWNP